MKKQFRPVIAAAFLLAACSQGGAPSEAASAASVEAPAPAKSGEPAPVSDKERHSAIASLNLTPAADGKVMNDCDEGVQPDYYSVDLGGDVGRAIVIVIAGGPTTVACYGNAGMRFSVLKAEDGGFRPILSDYGMLAVLTTSHDGVKDLAVGGPGFEFPVYAWNDDQYAQSGTISDKDFPTPINK